MDKNTVGHEINETKGILVNKQNQENLEISSTGYGYEAVPLQSKQKKNPKM
jgi:hypothetical protein